MIEETLTPDAEAEWLARFEAALKDGPKITMGDVAAVTKAESLSSVLRFSGLSHLRLYWISLELFEAAKKAGSWSPQLVSDLSCVDWLIARKEGKPSAASRHVPSP